MSTYNGTLKKTKKGKFVVEYVSKKGKTVPLPIPDAACCFDAAIAQDGAAAILEMDDKGNVRKVTVEGQPETTAAPKKIDTSPRPTGHHRPSPQKGGHDNKNQPALRNGTAPFNFIPQDRIARGFKPAEGVSSTETISGSIRCTLKALTPLLVAGPQQRSVDENIRSFFRINGVPTIPASSLKGLIRSTLETLSLSYLFPVSKKTIPYRDIGSDTTNKTYISKFVQSEGQRYRPLAKSGFLEFRGAEVWLYPCEWARLPHELINDFFGGQSPLFSQLSLAARGQKGSLPAAKKLTAKEKLKEWTRMHGGAEVGFDLDPRQWHKASGSGNMEHFYNKVSRLYPGAGQERGYVFFTGHMDKKKKDYLFFDVSEQGILLSPSVYEEFRDQMSRAQKDYWEELEKNYNKRIPIFYLVDDHGDPFHLGLAQLFRVRSKTSPYDLLEKQRADRDQESDFCQCLFGFCGQNESLKGRVSFSAGKFSLGSTSPEVYRQVVAGQPSPSCSPLYLVQPDTVCRRESGWKVTNIVETYNSDKVVLRGKKQYWHRNPEVPPPPNDNPKVQATYEPLKAGVEFTFTVDFDRLSPAELGGLVEALSFPEGHAHKLGLGKPFGFGSVRIEIDGIEAWRGPDRYGDLAARLANTPSDTDLNLEDLRREFKQAIAGKASCNVDEYESLSSIKAFRTMTNFEKRPPNGATQYMPLTTGDKDTPSYTWRSILPDVKEV